MVGEGDPFDLNFWVNRGPRWRKISDFQPIARSASAKAHWHDDDDDADAIGLLSGSLSLR